MIRTTIMGGSASDAHQWIQQMIIVHELAISEMLHPYCSETLRYATALCKSGCTHPWTQKYNVFDITSRSP